MPLTKSEKRRLSTENESLGPADAPAHAVEGATGTRALLAQQLVAAGERLVDVPPKLAGRVRLLDNHHSDKTDRSTN